MKTYLLGWFNSLGLAYEAAEAASKQGARILELFPFASRAQLFVEVPANFSELKFLQGLAAPPDNIKFFPGLSEVVIRSYLSLTSPPLQNDLVISDFSFLGEALEYAALAEKVNLTILDIRFMRDTNGHTHVFLTGTKEQADKFLNLKEIDLSRTRRIQNPSEHLREFFPKA